MGRIGEVAVRVVMAHIQTLMGFPVDILKPLEVPPEAFREHRQQYDAGTIIKYLNGIDFPHHAHILALTTVDLCTPILTYVFGEAELGGRTALVSTHRLRSNEDGGAAPLDLYYERLAKVSLHEAAHTLSLYHCDDARCIMHFSAKSHHLDQIAISFCERCEFMLRQNLKQCRI